MTSPKVVERFGLGYKPTTIDWMNVHEMKRLHRAAKLENREVNTDKLIIPHLYGNFKKDGVEMDNLIMEMSDLSITSIIKEHEEHEIGSLVYPYPLGSELNNWETIELPVHFEEIEQSFKLSLFLPCFLLVRSPHQLCLRL